jgi:hypothetical protein
LILADRLGWLATAILIVASGINGLGYYPLGPISLAAGGMLWLVVAILRRDWPLIVTNLVMGVVGIGTIIYTLTRTA